MGVEFLRVEFPGDRNVLADGNRVGPTNHTLALRGPQEYIISLDGPPTNPPSRDVVLAGTSKDNPKVVRFA
jgi:hypothetical protein